MNKIQQVCRILDDALRTYKPSLIVLSYSGGYDSMCSSHLTAQWARKYAHSANVMTVAVNTTISADGWLTYIQESCREMRLPNLNIERTTMFHQWASRMVRTGMVYTKGQHKINFYHLKQVAFRAVTQKYKKHWQDRIMFVNGVRRLESKERQSAKPVTRHGCSINVNPILNFSSDDVMEYRVKHNLPENPFYDITGNSGDCLCNWHTAIDIDDVKEHSPKAYQRLIGIHEQCRVKWGYGYGEQPDTGVFDNSKQTNFFDLLESHEDDLPNLCSTCRKPTNNDSLNSVGLQRFDWSEDK